MCVCVCVCITYVLLTVYIFHFIYKSQLPPSSRPRLSPRYTPTLFSPLIYAKNRKSPFPHSYRRPVLSVPLCPSRFIHARARSVSSLFHPSALVAANCAPLCCKGIRKAGFYTSLLLETSLPAQSHTFQSIPASACSCVVRLTSSVQLMPPLRVFCPQSRPLE